MRISGRMQTARDMREVNQRVGRVNAVSADPTNPKEAGSKAKRPELCIAKVKMKKTIILPQVKKWFKKVQKRVSTATWKVTTKIKDVETDVEKI